MDQSATEISNVEHIDLESVSIDGDDQPRCVARPQGAKLDYCSDEQQKLRPRALLSLVMMALIAMAIFGVSFSVFHGFVERNMKIASYVCLSMWGLYLSATVLAVVKMTSAKFVRRLSFVCMGFSFVTAFGMSWLGVTACGPFWLPIFYYFAGQIGIMSSIAVWVGFSANFRPSRRYGIALSLIFFVLFAPNIVLWTTFYQTSKAYGGIDESIYPVAATSPYILPFEGTSFVSQGNKGRFSHFDSSNFYAYDFHMACGKPVRAARSGEVVEVVDDRVGNYMTGNELGNYVRIRHEDGSEAEYLHIMTNSALVERGMDVVQGQRIASVGNTGLSSGPHLHFSVTQRPGYDTTPVSFHDVYKDNGIPRTCGIYSS